ncbi:MAG: BamA/TamA family outer membrane protein [Bacteroidota bacterium]|nr:BamA/TamA family outer membrane protein [Bacteroidota bacterium]
MTAPNKIFFIILFWFSTFSFPQVIKNVKITGNKYFSNSEITDFARVPQGSKVTPAVLDAVKKNIYSEIQKYGFFDARLDSSRLIITDTTSAELIISIDEGERANLKQIKYLNAEKVDSISIIPKFEFLVNRSFNKYELEDNISQSLTFYENNGYPFAKIIIVSLNLVRDSVKNETSIEALLNLDKGTPNNIDRVEIKGNTKTKDFVILRELRLNSGERYIQKRIDDLPRKLNKLRFFDPVAVPGYYIDQKGRGVLQVEVKEKVTNNFDGIIGYIPGTSPGVKGYVTGLVNVNLRNLFGTGRAFAFRWQQLNKSSQELELKYLEPWLFSYPFNITVGLFQKKQDSSYVQRRFDGTVEYLASDIMTAAFTISSEDIYPNTEDSTRFTVYSSNSIVTGVSLSIDTRDDPYAPTSGLLFANSYSYSSKKINGPAYFLTPGMDLKSSLQRITLDFSFFWNPFTTQVLAIGTHARELKGDFFEISDLYKLGGTSTLRGYTENQFLGSRIFWSNLEYRLLLTKRSYFFGFYDTGYFLRKEDASRNIQKTEGFRMGYGLGLSLETKLGILAVSYALGKGDTFSTGKIHFGIINEF